MSSQHQQQQQQFQRKDVAEIERSEKSQKEIVLDVSQIKDDNEKDNLLSTSYLSEAKRLGITGLLMPDVEEISSIVLKDLPDNLTLYSLIHDSSNIRESTSCKVQTAVRLTISSSEDISKASNLADSGGINAIIAETPDWKVIPLENLVAELHARNSKIFATVSNVTEIETLFGVLEVGVDGVVVSSKQIKDVARIKEAMMSFVPSLNLSFAEVVSVQGVGSGERVCVDTTSLLKEGESLLVGSKSNFLFAVHNEGIGSPFSAPRPFRVNAGAIHSYVLLPNGKTSYLSEIESGNRVLVVNREGKTRSVTVGRSKIETRPLVLVKAAIRNDGNSKKDETATGSVIVQNAETIRFVGERRLISVTELKRGDAVLVFSTGSPSGRHFGTKVDEYILEK
jgi:3-dehydroquinate synthase II